MKVAGETPRPSASLTGVPACNCILTEVYSGRGQQQQIKACQTLNRALLALWHSHRHARGCAARPGMPSFDAGWDFVAQLNISWPFQLPNPFSSSPLATLSLFTNSCLPSFSPCYWCQRRISLTDSLQQMVLQGPVAFYRPDSTIYSLLMYEWHVQHWPFMMILFFLITYTNRWDGGLLIKGL